MVQFSAYSYLRLTQMDRWIEVQLIRPEFVSFYWCWMGKYVVGPNSLDRHYNYSLGQAPPERNLWIYQDGVGEITFADGVTWAGGGMAFGQTESTFQRIATLEKVRPPFAWTSSGQGSISVGSALFRPGVPITWESIPQFSADIGQ